MSLGLNTILLVIFLVVIILFYKKHSRYHGHTEQTDERILQEYGTPEKTLYVSSKVLSLHQATEITDANENVVYTSTSKVLTLHDRTRIYDVSGKEIAYVYRKFFTLHERRIVRMHDGTEFQLSNELFHIIKDITNIEGLGWKLEGNILSMNFTIKDEHENILAVIGQKYLSIHDKYSVDIYDPSEEEYIVTILISLQHMIRERAAAASSASSSTSSSSN